MPVPEAEGCCEGARAQAESTTSEVALAGHMHEWESAQCASTSKEQAAEAQEAAEVRRAAAKPYLKEEPPDAPTAKGPVDLRQAKEELQAEVRQQSKGRGKGKGRPRPDRAAAAASAADARQKQRAALLQAKQAAVQEVEAAAKVGKGRATAYRPYDARAFYTKRPAGIDRDDWGNNA
jgi:hypothetical protein